LSAGAYALYYNMNAYPLPTATTLPAYDKPNANDAQMWWYGLYLDGKLGPVNINLDGIMDRGKVMGRDSYYGFPNFIPDVKYRGWAAHAKIDFPWEKFNFGVLGYYATGADAEDTDPTGLPGGSPRAGFYPYNKKVSSYVIPPGSESGAAYGESVVFYSFWGNRGDSGIANTLNYNQMCRGPMGGTWMAKAYASAKIAPWYKLTFQGMYIGDTTKNADTFGNAMSYSFFFGSQPRDKKDIGWEFDIINEIQIYKQLKLTVAGGYLFAGKAMDQYAGFDYSFGPFSIAQNEGIKNPWALMWSLVYTF
ncbi:MAG: hypothetical protein WCA12_14795, partial [Burkholderiales bacterium]